MIESDLSCQRLMNWARMVTKSPFLLVMTWTLLREEGKIPLFQELQERGVNEEEKMEIERLKTFSGTLILILR